MSRVPLLLLRKLAKATHRKKLCRWLEQNGIAYRLDCNDQPIVLEATLARAFDPAAQGVIAGEFIPDFTKLEEPDGKKKASRRRPA